MKQLEDYVTSIPDFPKPGILFRDITTIINDKDGFKMAIDGLIDLLRGVDFDYIVGAESRGFIFGAPIAYELGKPFVLVRKKGKLPRETVSESYDLEYGSATIEMHTDSFPKGSKIVLVDDLLATGGTIKASANLVDKLDGKVVKIIFVMELKGLNGREKLKGYDVGSLIQYEGGMKGNLGIIACPMFEDELVFALKNDKDEKSIYVVDTGYTETIVDKLKKNGLTFVMMDQYTLNTDMGLDDGFNVVIIMNPMRLHTEPDKLKKHIEEQADFYCERFDVITLYYAMCGNFGWDMTDWMSRRTKTPFIMFRDDKGKVCDDCIGVAVGGTQEYYDLVRKYSGQLFLTPCTATNWGKYSENREWEGLFDSEDDYMKFLFQMGGYKYALKIDTGLGDRERYDAACIEVAKRMELELKEPESKVATTKLAMKIWNESKEALAKVKE